MKGKQMTARVTRLADRAPKHPRTPEPSSSPAPLFPGSADYEAEMFCRSVLGLLPQTEAEFAIAWTIAQTAGVAAVLEASR
jgi:hypothetical protein